MPRPLRVVVPGQPVHLIHRGNNRSACFSGDEDRAIYRYCLRQASESCGCAIHAYVLMTNHVHLLVTPSHRDAPARLMQSLGRSYVRCFNDRHERTGPLWDGRFRSTSIDSERYFLACSRYIESNPVRAGMVARPDEHPWSSFRHNALGGNDSLVTAHAIYLALGRSASSRQARYGALFSTSLDPSVLEEIRGPEVRSRARGAATGASKSEVTNSSVPFSDGV